MKILVPVDFHNTSFAAFNYAANLSKTLNADIVLLHVLNGGFNTNEVVSYDPLLNMEAAASKRLDYFATEYPHEVGIKLPKISVEKYVRFGIPGFTISEFVKEKNIDLIVMGTRDTHGFFDAIIGSTSGVTIRQATCPVILIHENTIYTDIQKIVFAFDEKSDLEDALQNYAKFNNVIKAKTDFVHIIKGKKEDLSDQKEEIVDAFFEDQNPTFAFEIKAIHGKDVDQSIKDYCIFEKADMIAMMHRKEGVFSSIFRKQHSVKVAQSFHLPVIIFHEN